MMDAGNLQRALRTFVSSARLQMKQSFARGMMKFTLIFSPLFMGILLGYVYMGRSDLDFASFAMIGTAATTIWTSISFSSASDVNRERYMGALPQIFNAPPDFFVVMAGKIAGNTILGIISMLLSYLYVGALFGRWVTIPAPMAFLCVLVLLILSYMALAMMISGAMAVSRQMQVLMNCLDYPMFILCGCAYPISVLPHWMQSVSNILSPTHGIAALRICLDPNPDTAQLLSHMVALLTITAAYWVIAVLIYRHIDFKIRKDATLEVM